MGGYCQRFDVEHPVSDPANPYASTPSGAQPPYAAQPGYGQASPGQQTPYGTQPGCAPVNPSRFDSLRTYSTVITILSILSWFTLHLAVSIPVMIWAIILARKARAEETPADVRSAVRAARLVSIIMVVLQVIIVIVGIALFLMSLEA